MIKILLSDLSKVLLFAKDKSYNGRLNDLNKQLAKKNENYDFWFVFELNDELLKFYKTIDPNISKAVFTSEDIQDNPAIAPILAESFSEIVSAAKLGLHKKDVDSYTVVAEKLGVSTSDILYIDDKLVFVEAAKKSGMQALLFESNEQVIKDLKKSLVHDG